ncbi:MFS transporter [Acidovorax sp. FJL06]|uniref:MFS transporter n=1 Tax=Acidovorax sp. FJL06 TaxID=2153365 RepID=UPI000F58B01F|nr:MFS transporter [Acidovorax sp. FJL06]RQO80635.1 MFS transporter [Acidovorax sp. FJL06]
MPPATEAAARAQGPGLPRRVVLCLSASQFICWGISYYLVGAIGEFIIRDTGWSRTLVYGGFAGALLVMGGVSGAAGGWVDRWGGRGAMVAGSLLLVAGCVGIAVAQGVWSYCGAWAVMGLAMRLTLYDAAFATLAHLAGPRARRPMAQVTLLGGLASTAFWPLGHVLADALGWRGAVLVYAVLACCTVLLHLGIPRRSAGLQRAPQVQTVLPAEVGPLARTAAQRALAGTLFATLTTLVNFLNAGMSAHMVGLLAGLGLALPLAVGVASLRGVGQSSARLAEVLWGAQVSPLVLGALASLLLPAAVLAGLWSGQALAAAWGFALAYGAGNGLLTITRGTLPLVLFDHRSYGACVGWLVAPGFLLSAGAPVVYAMLIDHAGAAAAMWLSVGVAALAGAAAWVLWLCFAPRGGRAQAGAG